MLYLTGASNSLSRSPINTQDDPSKSLGGYVSSSSVPNAALNVLFDSISSLTTQKKFKETIGLALINKLTTGVKDVTIKVVTHPEDLASYLVAIVPLGSGYSMEQIANRYQEPIMGDFHNVSFQRAYVDVTIVNPAVSGEEIALYPFNVVVSVSEGGVDGTWGAIEKGFAQDTTYTAYRLTDNTFRIESRTEEVLSAPLECSFLSTESCSFSFSGGFANGVNNTSSICDLLNAEEGVGIWVQRVVNKASKISNEELVDRRKNGYISADLEQVELIIGYDETDRTEYSDDYNDDYLK